MLVKPSSYHNIFYFHVFNLHIKFLKWKIRYDLVEAYINLCVFIFFLSDLVFYLPITILLPTLSFGSRYSRAGSRKSRWYDSFLGRSFYDSTHQNLDNDIRGPVDRVLTKDVIYDPHLLDYQVHR